MSTAVFTDVEEALRMFVRGLDLPGVGTRVFFGFPDGNPALPLITVARIGGGPQRGEAPLEDPRISLEIWGRTKKAAADAAMALANALAAAACVLTEQTYVYAVEVDTLLWAPDPSPAKLPRYILDCTLTVRPG